MLDKVDFARKQKTLFERQKKLRENPTKSEMIFKKLLDDNNIYYIFQKGFIKGNCYCIVDFYIPGKKICIEVDGLYHQSLLQRKKDNYKDKYLLSRGFKIVRIKNDDVQSVDIKSIIP